MIFFHIMYAVENVKLNLLFSLTFFKKFWITYIRKLNLFCPFFISWQNLKHFARSFHEAQTPKLGGVVYAWNSITTIVLFTYFFEPKKSIMPHLNNKNDVISLFFCYLRRICEGSTKRPWITKKYETFLTCI